MTLPTIERIVGLVIVVGFIIFILFYPVKK